MPSEWGIRAQIRNAYLAPSTVDHVCCIPVQVRLDWRVKGVQIVDGIASGWRGKLVRVHLADEGVEVWVISEDVRRRVHRAVP